MFLDLSRQRSLISPLVLWRVFVMALDALRVLVHGLDGRRQETGLCLTLSDLSSQVESLSGLPPAFQVLSSQGKLLHSQTMWENIISQHEHGIVDVHVSVRLLGGKGGFGSLLRSKKARKKTTNFGSARMLDGRRLRDVQAETRINEGNKARATLEEMEQKARLEARRERDERIQAAEQRFQQTRRDIIERVHSSVEMGILAAKLKRQEEELAELKKAQEATIPGFEFLYAHPPSPFLIPFSEDLDSNGEDLESDDGEEDSNDDGEDSDEEENQEKEEKEAEEKAPQPQIGSDSEQGERGLKRVLEPDVVSEEPLLDLMKFNNEDEMEALGADALKHALGARGMKVGGTLKERAHRLWLARGVDLEMLDAALLAPKNKKPRQD